jgi:hypothetical protein
MGDYRLNKNTPVLIKRRGFVFVESIWNHCRCYAIPLMIMSREKYD